MHRVPVAKDRQYATDERDKNKDDMVEVFEKMATDRSVHRAILRWHKPFPSDFTWPADPTVDRLVVVEVTRPVALSRAFLQIKWKGPRMDGL